MRKLIGVIIALVLVLILAVMSIGSVPQNNVGIMIRAGVVQTSELTEGWHFKVPFVDTIVCMSNQVQNMRISAGTGKNDTTTESGETSDRQLIPTYEFTIQYQLTKSESFTVYKNFGTDYASKLIAPNAVAVIKQVFSGFASEDIVNNKTVIPAMVRDMLDAITSQYGITIVNVMMNNYDFTPEYTALLEERAYLAAQVKNNEIKQENERIAAQTAYDVAVKAAEREAETNRLAAENANAIALAKAQADAEANRIAVDNEAYVTVTAANAEKTARLAAAEALKAELEAQASGLNDLVVQKAFIERWNGVMVPTFGNGMGFTLTDLTEVVKSYLTK